MTDERRFRDLETAARALAIDISDTLSAAIAARGRASLAASGGRTPETVFPLLAGQSLDWARVTVTLTDERWVAPDDPASNEGLARRLLLQGPAAAATFVGLRTDGAMPDDGLAAAEARFAGVPQPLDAVYLGLGADGHIASLFPHDPAWPMADAPLITVDAAPDGRARISLGPRPLLAARRLFLLFHGADKARAFEVANEKGPVADCPLRLVLAPGAPPLSVYRAP